MSYILDALKKAEHDRNLGDAPRLTFAPLSESRSQRSRVLWVVVAVLGITVGVLGAMQISQMRSGQAPAPVVAEKPQPAKTEAKPKPKMVVVAPEPAPVNRPEPPKSKAVQVNTPQGPVEVEMPLTPDATVPAQTAASAKTERPAPEPKPEPALQPQRKIVDVRPQAEPATSQMAAPESSDPDLSLPSAAELAAEYEAGTGESYSDATLPEEAFQPEPQPEPEENLVSYNGLPASTRSSIGELAMNAHIYSTTPGRGFVLINGSRYHEGDRLDEGPTLVEIRQEGAVLDYRGQRFLLPVPR